MSRRSQHDKRAVSPAPKISDDDLARIIGGGDMASTELLVRYAEQFGYYLKDSGLKSSQIRNIFTQVRQIEMNWTLEGDDPSYAQQSVRELLLLKPKLAYQRERVKETGPLGDLLSRCIDFVQGDRANFQRFVEFFEAILAYHKAAGGE